MADVDELFGDECLPLKKFTDVAGVLRRKERHEMWRLLARFEKKFPQLFFSIYVGAFEEVTSLRQFGFWLLNRAVYSDVEAERPNENGILLVLDVNGKTAAMTFGYAVMPYLNEDSTFGALSAAHPFLIQGEYLKAFRAVMMKTEQTLKKGWINARKDPDSFFAACGQSLRKEDHLLIGNEEGGDHPADHSIISEEEESR